MLPNDEYFLNLNRYCSGCGVFTSYYCSCLSLTISISGHLTARGHIVTILQQLCPTPVEDWSEYSEVLRQRWSDDDDNVQQVVFWCLPADSITPPHSTTSRRRHDPATTQTRRRRSPLCHEYCGFVCRSTCDSMTDQTTNELSTLQLTTCRPNKTASN